MIGAYNQYPDISVDPNYNAKAGYDLKIMASITATQAANIHVCFIDNSNGINVLNYSSVDYYCVKCATILGIHCRSPLTGNLIQEHQFSVTVNYTCNKYGMSSYTISMQKHHVSTEDSGIIMYLVATGKSNLNRTINLNVMPGNFKLIYMISGSVVVVLAIVVSFSVAVRHLLRNRCGLSHHKFWPVDDSNRIGK